MKLRRSMGRFPSGEERDFTREKGELYSNYQTYLGGLMEEFSEKWQEVENDVGVSLGEKRRMMEEQKRTLLGVKLEYDQQLRQIHEDEALYLADTYGVPPACQTVGDGEKYCGESAVEESGYPVAQDPAAGQYHGSDMELL